MEEPTQVELLIRALRGVIRKFSSDNPTDYSPSFQDKSHDTCYICKEIGHWATECSNRDKNKKGVGRDKSQDTCYYCKEKGHWSPNCPKKQQEQEEEEEKNSEWEEEEVPSPKEEVRHVHKDKKKRRNESDEEKEKHGTVKKLKKQKE